MADDLGKLFEAAWVELPVAAAKRGLATKMKRRFAKRAGRPTTRGSGWPTTLPTAFTRIRPSARSPAAEFRRGLQVTRVVDAVASAIFGNLWPAIGLPTANDMQALRADVKSLREETPHGACRIEAPEAGRSKPTMGRMRPRAAPNPEIAAADIIWNGYKPAPKRTRKGGKKSVAL